MSEGTYFKHYQRLMLLLWAVDDVDVTYFNGVEVGRTGSAPEDTKGHYETIRRYDVPAENIRWNAENVIAVRVFDGDGDGGGDDEARWRGRGLHVLTSSVRNPSTASRPLT